MSVGTAGYKKDIENFIDELNNYLKKYQSKHDSGGNYTRIAKILRDQITGVLHKFYLPPHAQNYKYIKMLPIKT